ncbi:Hypothetical protein AA314_04533 [Archangium gephyra]|uniref:Uncharacterized protein n=1 Tax=Archangium gephyra TaxID=48 RepID=A0AAC8TEI8_9BACT|nr:Hypothetical protein AA314_04533 [Archangium gephyra]
MRAVTLPASGHCDALLVPGHLLLGTPEPRELLPGAREDAATLREQPLQEQAETGT